MHLDAHRDTASRLVDVAADVPAAGQVTTRILIGWGQEGDCSGAFQAQLADLVALKRVDHVSRRGELSRSPHFIVDFVQQRDARPGGGNGCPAVVDECRTCCCAFTRLYWAGFAVVAKC